jgi:hypothetical protein
VTQRDTNGRGRKEQPAAQARDRERPEESEKRHVLRSISGSDDEDFCTILAEQVVDALWREHPVFDQQIRATLAAMMGMKPQDELEGMLIGQLIASHNAAMECYRRAMIGNQTFEGRRENLNQANKLSRSSAALTEALDRHRGKGQQRITVEHVNVHAGGQAIVGAVTPKGGSSQKSEQQTHATQEITHEPGIPMRSPDPERETMPIASGAGKAPV